MIMIDGQWSCKAEKREREESCRNGASNWSFCEVHFDVFVFLSQRCRYRCELCFFLLRRETRPKILWITGNKKKIDDGAGNSQLTVDVSAEEVQPIVDAVATPSATYHRSHDSIETINARVKEKIGIDFLKEAKIDKRTRYLSKVCGGLAELGSAERDAQRNGISLQKWNELGANTEESTQWQWRRFIYYVYWG